MTGATNLCRNYPAGTQRAPGQPARVRVGGQTEIRGVYPGGTNFKRDIQLYAELYLQGRFNLDDLVSQTIAASDINAAYAALEGGGIARSVITSF